MPQAEKAQGQYLYGIILCPESDHNPAEMPQFTTLGIGERGDPVYTIHFMDLAAVVSNSPIMEYDSSRRNMMAHTLVQEEVMRSFTMLPVRFSTMAPGAEAVKEKLLKRRFGEFHGLLQQREGRVELGLKAFWYEEVILQETVDQNPQIRRLRDSLMGRRPEETYYERIRLGEMIENDMGRKRDEDAERILTPLRPLVVETRVNKTITDRMVLNAAFLVEERRQGEFDEAVKKLDEGMGKRFIFKYVGPVPPYNFVNIVVAWEDEPPPQRK